MDIRSYASNLVEYLDNVSKEYAAATTAAATERSSARYSTSQKRETFTWIMKRAALHF